MSRMCPTPHKRGWPSRSAALTALRGLDTSRLYAPTAAYRCRCGSWHVTSHKYAGRRR
jgi:hypothetical protein